MVRNRMVRFRCLPAVVTVIALFFPLGAGADDVKKTQMGGAIQGVPLSLSGVTSTIAGVSLVGSQDGKGTAARFYAPESVTTDGTNLYVADTLNRTIRKIVIATGEVTTLAGAAGFRGSTDDTGAAARFRSPTGITMDGTNLYVADFDNHTIRKVVIATGAVTTLAGTAGSYGSADGTGAAARFHNLRGITTDGTSLYVADMSNAAIRKIDIATGEVTTLAGKTGCLGGTDGTGAAARFYHPYGITTDSRNLYVTDTELHTIRKVAIATGEVTTLAGMVLSSGSIDDRGATARFNLPPASRRTGQASTSRTRTITRSGRSQSPRGR